tara:strand:- start:822 stop:1232 length:411 start_codon:yes stop_codon:yes gene_type:complete
VSEGYKRPEKEGSNYVEYKGLGADYTTPGNKKLGSKTPGYKTSGYNTSLASRLKELKDLCTSLEFTLATEKHGECVLELAKLADAAASGEAPKERVVYLNNNNDVNERILQEMRRENNKRDWQRLIDMTIDMRRNR